jgi:four helix bundle protein
MEAARRNSAMSNTHSHTQPSHLPRAGLHGFDAYVVARQFRNTLKAALHGRALTENVTQAMRAAEAVVRGVAEAYPTLGADRARRFRIAAGEASECVATLDLLEDDAVVCAEALAELRRLLDRECAMLWRLSRPR